MPLGPIRTGNARPPCFAKPAPAWRKRSPRSRIECGGPSFAALREEARRILLKSAHIFEVREGLFADSGLDRLRRLGVPYPALIKVAGGSMPPMSPSDPYRQSLEGKADAVLTRNLNGLKEQGMAVLRRYRAASGE